MNVLINVSERRFHLNNVNFYVKNHGSVNTNGKRIKDTRGEKLQDFVKQQQDYERGERIAEREIERDRIAAEKLRQIRKGKLKGIKSRRKRLRQIRKGNLKGIGSRRRKRKWRISSQRKKKIGKSS